MTSVSDNFHKLMCTSDKFSLTSFALISLICWCERINKFSLTSLHCSQQYKYTADNKKSCCHPPLQRVVIKNKTAARPQFLHFLDKFSMSTLAQDQFLQCVNFLLNKCSCSKKLAFKQVHLSRKNLTSSSLHTGK